MKAKVCEGLLLVLFLLTTALVACTDDEPKDRVKEIRMTVLPETGIMYSLFDDKQENPIECLLVKTDDNPNQIERLGMNRIEGFTYERGHEYYLSVKRTILANPPADGYNRTYKLIRILQDRLVAEPSTKVDNDIKSEADIEYNDLCPFTKYSISTKYLVNADGAIFYADGRKLPSYKSARIWLDNILDKADANWYKFQSTPYQAYYSFVVTPFADQLRLVYNNSDGPMFKDVVPEEEFSKIKLMQPGESVRYSLVLANIHKKGLQKLEFAVEKQ